MPDSSNADDARCSFCGKRKRQVEKLIAGPGVYICDECVRLSHDILTEEIPDPPALAAELEIVCGRLYDLGSDASDLAKRLRELALRADDLGLDVLRPDS